MPDDIAIHSSTGDYVVSFVDVERHDSSEIGRFPVVDAFFRTDPRFDHHATVWIEATEQNKSLTTVERVICELRSHAMSREGHLLAIGGGIVQDVATLAASLYMRGVNWTYIPTTLLGMVDSCIGGKSSINTSTTKNLIGNIYPPQAVLIDTRFVYSLSRREIYSGFAEALKIAFCGGESSFVRMLELLKLPSNEMIPEIVHLSLTTKKWFIERDEFDQAERLQLNFGHTFGHALEVATDYQVPHGLAVAIGMACASRFAASRDAVHSQVKELEDSALLLARRGIDGDSHITFSPERFLAAFKSDKKHPPGHFRLVLPRSNPGVELSVLKASSSLEAELSECVSQVMSEVLS